MEKYFDINEAGCSVRCKLYADDPRAVRHAVIYGHGFSGHKDTRAAEKFARYALSKFKGVGVLCFDLPCHGEDARKKLRLSDCDAYIDLVCRHAREALGAQTLSLYATSFGAYLQLRHIALFGSPYRRLVLRSPAVNMIDALTTTIMGEAELEKLRRGKEVLVGFDRKIRIGADFLEELRQQDIRSWEFYDYADDILILHGTKDEIISFDAVRDFADQNVIAFLPVENADHRFQDPRLLERANIRAAAFMEL